MLPVGYMSVRIISTMLMPLLVLFVVGCGEARHVTYVDPNGASPPAQTGDGGEPFIRHGAAATERARACIAVRVALTVARTLAVTDAASASGVLERTLVNDLPAIEPRGIAGAPRATAQLRTGIEQLRTDPPKDVAQYNVQVQRLSERLLARTCDVVVPQTARQDSSFRAGMLHETLQDAASSYEAAFDGTTTQVHDIAAYQRAYGLLVDASTRQLEAVPESDRPQIRAQLDKLTRRAASSPVPPAKPYDPTLVVDDLSTLADDVAASASIDPTYPSPAPETPDQLRTLKRMLAAAVEAHERGANDDALQQLRHADETGLEPAASGVASVSATLLVELDRDLLITLPAAFRAGGDVVTIASDIDGRIDEAISLVEEELELIRESS